MKIGQDLRRRSYGVKVERLGDLYLRALGLDPHRRRGLVLKEYKSAEAAGKTAGDFAATVQTELQGRDVQRVPGDLGPSIGRVNELLDQLAAADSEEQRAMVIAAFVREFTALENKWLVRIILKDLKVQIRHESFLAHLHPDAKELYNATVDLERICGDDALRTVSEAVAVGIRPGVAFQPMLCARVQMRDGGHDAADDIRGAFVIEEKMDGERIIAHKLGDEIRFFTRRATDYTAQYGPVFAALLRERVRAHTAILDGEMLAWDTRREAFVPFGENRTVAGEERAGASEGRQLCYMLYDVLWVEGDHVGIGARGNLTLLPLSRRKDVLRLLIPDTIERRLEILPFTLVTSSETERREAAIAKAFAEAIDDGHEGVVIKSWTSEYKCNERSRHSWLKLKPEYIDGFYDTMEVVIVGASRGEGNHLRPRAGDISHFVVAVAGQPLDPSGELRPTDQFYTIGRVGTGYSFRELERLRARIKDFLIPVERRGSAIRCPPWLAEWRGTKAENVPEFLVPPNKSVVVEVQAAELVPSRDYSASVCLRFPRVLRIREDRGIEDCMTMADVRRIMQESGGKLARRQDHAAAAAAASDPLRAPSRGGRKKRGRQGTGGDESDAKRGRAGAALGAQYRLRDGVEAMRSESSVLEGVQAAVLPVSFTLDDLDLRADDPKDREVLDEARDDAVGFVQQLIVQLGGRCSVGVTADTNLVVAKRGVRVQNLVASFQRTLTDIDVVSPAYIVDCWRAEQRVERLPHHLVFSGPTTRAALPRYVDAFGDVYTQDLTPHQLQVIAERLARDPEAGRAPDAPSDDDVEGLLRDTLHAERSLRPLCAETVLLLPEPARPSLTARIHALLARMGARVVNEPSAAVTLVVSPDGTRDLGLEGGRKARGKLAEAAHPNPIGLPWRAYDQVVNEWDAIQRER